MQKSDLIPYEYDASNIKGLAKDILFPKTIEELKKNILENPRICIRGGGTGLAGGAVPEQNQDIVVDTSKLIKIGNIDLDRKTIEVEAGVILEDLQNYLRKYNLEFPVNPSSRSACTIGGMIATNAVGSRAIKYKNTENWVRWIEVIDADGNLDRKGRTETSDYAGMEGITGIIAKACLNLITIPKRSATLIKITNKEKIIEIVRHLKQNKNVSMIEFIDKKISEGLDFSDNYHLIVEYEDETGLLKEEEYEELMQKRYTIYPFLAGEGYTKIEDPKITLDKFEIFLEWFEKHNIPLFGHLSVGILHPCFYEGQEKHIPELMKLVKKTNGKISGEHGIGILKKQYIEANDKKILENIKKRTDPKNKFNIGKII